MINYPIILVLMKPKNLIEGENSVQNVLIRIRMDAVSKPLN